MKKYAAIVCLLLMAAACTHAQQRVPENRVTLQIKDTLLKSAIEQVLQYGTAKYKIDPALDKPPYDRIFVSIKFGNVPFSDALTDLLQAHGLAIRIEGGAGIIYPVGALPVSSAPGSLVPGIPVPLDLVSMTVPRLPIAEALRMLYRDAPKQVSFGFQGKLETAIMPGATFRWFPRDEAAEILLVAAGLVPPPHNDRIVRSAGPADLASMITYVPPGPMIGGYSRVPTTGVPHSAVAAYRSQTSTSVLLVVLANQEQDFTVLDGILGASGMNYVLGPINQPSSLVTIRLCGVTLQQALDGILPSMNLRYRIQGPTIFIESAAEPPDWVKPALPTPSPP